MCGNRKLQMFLCQDVNFLLTPFPTEEWQFSQMIDHVILTTPEVSV